MEKTFITKMKSFGNSLGVIIPSNIVKQLSLEKDINVAISITPNVTDLNIPDSYLEIEHLYLLTRFRPRRREYPATPLRYAPCPSGSQGSGDGSETWQPYI